MDSPSEITYSFKNCIELELIDCNCNNCIFMNRDIDKYKKWEIWHRSQAEKQYYQDKGKAICEAWSLFDKSESEIDERHAKGMLRVAMKMKFQFDKSCLIQYGKCEKLNKSISFLPNTCQIETQNCFKHRRS